MVHPLWILLTAALCVSSAGVHSATREHLMFETLAERTIYDLADDTPRPSLRALARYYAQFDVLWPLFQSLQTVPFRIVVRAGGHVTEQRRGQLSVHFDPFLAVQTRFRRSCVDSPGHCYTVPADALLHELLHVKQLSERPPLRTHPLGTATLEPVILAQEAQLFAAMSAQDGRPRPLRADHRGRPRAVRCALCLN